VLRSKRNTQLEDALRERTAATATTPGNPKRSTRVGNALCRGTLRRKERRNVRVVNVLPRRAATSDTRRDAYRRAVSVQERDRGRRRTRRTVMVLKKKRKR
jgi:hypothetical protein